MLSISVDEKEIKKLLKEKVTEILKEADAEYVFWDASELKRRTCMSWNFIQDQFFFDPRFPKRKVGSKWYFPSRETREFLEEWLAEQPVI
ncbi:group-specific protein [Paenibacillus sp. FSL K6-0108]|uniref:group-specific protein n=1 Tax=Paenibacillus sp. FSL K6-0108 TaxID=2921417 RepID=UPI0032542EDD